ncbi:hypothetical protein [Nostoc sp. CHAB 5715]|uniref:hypothetical protein n=1 Tax=Nostoc sp. CHAB 5715 TaxID=2780400 RepID=UPI001E379656|nr:hypothetical protein [Nostoc sp. CHAB 5715]MCC5621074.1 hypothetical protein [Nostoc sp. CHAB 5715]
MPPQKTAWQHLPTKPVRIPEIFEPEALIYVRSLDGQCSPFEAIISALDKLNPEEPRYTVQKHSRISLSPSSPQVITCLPWAIAKILISDSRESVNCSPMISLALGLTISLVSGSLIALTLRAIAFHSSTIAESRDSYILGN